MPHKNDPLITPQIYECVRCFKVGGDVETENKNEDFFLQVDEL